MSTETYKNLPGYIRSDEDSATESPSKLADRKLQRPKRPSSRSRSPIRDYNRGPQRTRSKSPDFFNDVDSYKPNYSKDGYCPGNRYGNVPPEAEYFYESFSPDRRDRFRGSLMDEFGRSVGAHHGRHNRPAPEYMVSNYDYDLPRNNTLIERVAPLEVNPSIEFKDPYTLPEMVNINYFADYLRSINPSTHVPDYSIQKQYGAYQKKFTALTVRNFIKEHNDEPWFKEKYDPECVEERLNKNKPKRLELYQKFVEGMNQGFFDEVCYDLPKRVKASNESVVKAPNNQGEFVNIIDSNGFETVLNSLLENQNDPMKKMTAEPDNFKALFVKNVPPSISRAQLTEVCSKVDTFISIIFSEPNPARKFHRLGWIFFKPETDLDEALKTLDKTIIDEFHFHFAIHTHKVKPRLTNEIAGSPHRLESDNKQIQELTEYFEKLHGPEFNIAPIAEARLQIVYRNNRSANQGEPNEDLWEIKKMLDLYIIYLRKVFNYCYYCCTSTESEMELQRRCRDNHYRPIPRLTYNRQGEQWTEQLDSKVQRRLIPDEGPAIEAIGGVNISKILSEKVKPMLEDPKEIKYRCSSCQKLFKEEQFIIKHLTLKHPDITENYIREAKIINNYLRDPNRVAPISNALSLALEARVNPNVSLSSAFPDNPIVAFPPQFIADPTLPSQIAGPPIRMGFPDQNTYPPPASSNNTPFPQPPKANIFPDGDVGNEPGEPSTSHTVPVIPDPRKVRSYGGLGGSGESEDEFDF